MVKILLIGRMPRRLSAIATGMLLLLPATFVKAADLAHAVSPKSIPSAILARLSTGSTQDIIVLYDDRDLEEEAAASRRRSGMLYDDEDILKRKADRYRESKQLVDADLIGDGETVLDFSHLPMVQKRFRSRPALELFLARLEVIAVYEDRPIYTQLAQSLPLLNQPAVAALGMTGSGVTVAVIDTGINYTLTDFGSCSAPGVPAGCRVAASVDVTGNGLTLNTAGNNHGTNVAGIVAAVAGGTRIASVNAFSNGSSFSSWIIAGINWAIANRSTYAITALNMSLGDGVNYTSTCGNSQSNPFVVPLNNARSAGILPVASAGNSAFTNGVSSPACIPGVVSVGAVYDSNVGGLIWGPTATPTCTDNTTAADQVACFSNSASFVTILAPGAMITAAGSTMGGTPQASPHVAGAVAVLRSAFPSDTLDQTIARMTTSGVSITDSRNGLSKPRLNMLAALGPPANDLFANKPILGGNSGQKISNNDNASKESGEPAHAGNAGGNSVWWSWTPSVTGMATFDTHSSTFDTLLAVYTGTSVGSLTQVVANDNDGGSNNSSGVSFQANAGTLYQVTVDGYSGAFGKIILNWNLSLQADLAVAMTQSPTQPLTGSDLTYSLNIINNGPSSADGVILSDFLPAGVNFVSASSGCTQLNGTVSCALGTLANGSLVTVQIEVTPGVAGNLTNTASVAAGTIDPLPGNNTATVVSTVEAQAAAVPALSWWGILTTASFLFGCTASRNHRESHKMA